MNIIYHNKRSACTTKSIITLITNYFVFFLSVDTPDSYKCNCSNGYVENDDGNCIPVCTQVMYFFSLQYSCTLPT